MGQLKLLVAFAAFLASSTLVHAQNVSEKAPASTPDVKEEGTRRVERFVATVGADGVQHVEVNAGEYYFDPKRIVVKVNVPVELRVKKEPGFIPHNIVIRAPDAGMNFDVDLEKEPRPIRFTPVKTGVYEMFCDEKLLFFKSHKEKGMKGVIEVVQ